MANGNIKLDAPPEELATIADYLETPTRKTTRVYSGLP